ncbi:Cation channel sperm-associated protein 2 [Acipenser ruthenus]|uniref:Cation channel sperm-associated protein 2 n=1 Tax=Acipenser ruthenus TaxID=7906 RepID=A0A444V317_ACIRT|nr:Cation channel sperm-associated protein 2 [Acipenser ruthenus]
MVTMKGFSDSSSPAQDPPPEGSSEEPSSEQTATELPVHTVKPTASATDWNAYVEDNQSVMRDQEEDEKVTWPRDSLFRYFELLEKQQYNLEMRKRLQNMAVWGTPERPVQVENQLDQNRTVQVENQLDQNRMDHNQVDQL